VGHLNKNVILFLRDVLAESVDSRYFIFIKLTLCRRTQQQNPLLFFSVPLQFLYLDILNHVYFTLTGLTFFKNVGK